MESVTLDDVDRGLVHALRIDGRAPFARIAEVLGVSENTVARRYRRLRSAGTLRVAGTVNGASLGYTPWTIRLRCTPDAAGAIASALATRPDVSYVYLLSGGTEISCNTQTGTAGERDALLLERLPRTRRVLGVSAHMLLGSPKLPKDWTGLDILTPDQTTALHPDQPPPRPHKPTPNRTGAQDRPGAPNHIGTATSSGADTPQRASASDRASAANRTSTADQASTPDRASDYDRASAADSASAANRADTPNHTGAADRGSATVPASAADRASAADPASGPDRATASHRASATVPASAAAPPSAAGSARGLDRATASDRAGAADSASAAAPAGAAERASGPGRAGGAGGVGVLGGADWAMLGVLALDGRASYAEIAAAAGWSEATARRRASQLRELGILAYQLDLAYERVGFRAEARLWMSVRPSRLRHVAEELAAHPESSFVAMTTGPTNLVAAVLCRDAADLARYLTERVASLEDIRDIETAPVIRTVKRAGTALPI
ncbi:Lrp/AsnC family transcriptional regulator [Actinomadura rupiterrae]|uniref:Lrp/AsnC family transcriptional regulator n=1 Tax=Actinomadura rupiterrae TaxID=559627 RepID=UPI0020A516AE|nr:Lrp/AsnC family transcriptional regulator [Actinomadura rupiterrae]MCP2335800.1 DNA-binding Lrp family transcriptional regulator [Actinomadura rupiterrae]